MASAITHFIVGSALLLPLMESRLLRPVLPAWCIPVVGGILAVAPDLDTYAARALDVSRGGIWTHRGVVHSPFFLLLVIGALAAVAVIGRGGDWRVWALFTAAWTGAAITHPLLDMLTDGGAGVMLFFPFSTERCFFPWRPIRVSPLGVFRFFSRAGEVLRSEAPFDLAAMAAGVLAWIARRGALD